MPNENKQAEIWQSKAIISEDVRDYGNDPFFVKKAEESKKVLEKYGFPKAIEERLNRG